MSAGKPTTFIVDDFIGELSPPVAVGAPIGDLVAEGRLKIVPATESPNTMMGVWECPPGRFRKQAVQAEFCHVLEGKGVFIPDAGEAVPIHPGAVVYFPPQCPGIWDIRATVRVVFSLFDGVTQAE